ncbi:MAG: PocR ligand-binding domain-containing protein [Candidatus Wallbacteria bacterium]
MSSFNIGELSQISVKFKDLFDIDEIQKLQDKFCEATGVASIITEPDGTPITRPSNFRKICKLIRCTEKGKANCYKSDATIGRHNPSGPIIKPCLSGGLWDAGANILVNDIHLGNWLIGQIRDETQAEEKIIEYARQIGADEAEIIEAFRQVPYMSKEKFKQIAEFLFLLAGQLSSKAYQNIQLSHYIMEKKEAEKNMFENEQKFRLIFENAPYSIVINRICDYKFVDVNSKFLKNNNLTKEEVLFKTPQQLVDFCNPEDLENITREFLRKGRVNQYHYKIIKQNGELVHELASLYPITFRNEKCVVSILVDITRQIKAEEALQELNNQLEQKVLEQTEMLRQSNKELNDTNRELQKTLTNLNTAQEHIIQSEKLSALGQLAAGIAHELNTPLGVIFSSSHSLTELADKKFINNLETIDTLGPKEKKCFKELLSKCFEKKLEIKLTHDRKKRKEIQAILESRGIKNSEFTASLILKTGIELSCFEKADFFECEQTDKILEYLIDIISITNFSRIIHNAAEKASHVVNALRSYLTSDSVEEVSSFDIENEIETTLTLFYNSIKHGITVERRFEPGLKVSGNRPKLNQVWMNLINNAIQAMNYKGILTIRTEKDDEHTFIHFSDTGTGIPESIKEKIFEPFFTTKKHGEGIGLGLDICKKIIEKYGGIIYFSSSPSGTTFSVKLPCRENK